MLSELKLELDAPKDKLGLYQSSNLHGVLMETIDKDYASYLYDCSWNPYSQHLESGRKLVWHIKTLNKEAYDNIIQAYNATENGEGYFGNIYNKEELLQNMNDNCIPESVFDMDADNYEDFLIQRRELMTKKIKEYFFSL